MFERYTDQARAVVVDAQLQARRLGHNYVGCEHLLLAVTSAEGAAGEALRGLGVTPESVQATTLRLLEAPPLEALDRDALATIGIDLDVVRQKVEAVFGDDALTRGTRPHSRWRRRRPCEPGSGHIAFTSRAKKCLELSLREALALRHRHVGVEHIALALTAMTDGLAPGILRVVGVTATQARTEILHSFREAG